MFSARTLAIPPDGLIGSCEIEFFQSLGADDAASMVALLEYGLHSGILAHEELFLWAAQATPESVKNPFSEKSSSSGAMVARIWDSQFSEMKALPARVMDWLKDLGLARMSRDESEHRTRWPARRAHFVTIPFSKEKIHGSRPRVAQNQRVVGKSFEIMDTPVTEWMLSQLLGGTLPLAPERADVPAVHVTLETIVEIANALSNAKVPLETAQLVIPDYRPGDRYIVPSSDVYRVLALAAGRKQRGDRLIDPLESVADIEWTVENAQGKIQPVGCLQPVVVSRQRIYDFFGNVEEVAIDKYESTGVRHVVTPGSVFANRECSTDRLYYTEKFSGLKKPAPVRWDWHSERAGFRLLRVERGAAQ